MSRTVGELRKFLENIPDEEEISFWVDGLVFEHESDGEFGNTLGSHIVTAQFKEYESDLDAQTKGAA